MHVGVHLVPAAQIERYDGVNVGQSNRRILLRDLLRRGAFVESGNDGVERYASLRNSNDAVLVDVQRNRFVLEYQGHALTPE